MIFVLSQKFKIAAVEASTVFDESLPELIGFGSTPAQILDHVTAPKVMKIVIDNASILDRLRRVTPDIRFMVGQKASSCFNPFLKIGSTPSSRGSTPERRHIIGIGARLF